MSASFPTERKLISYISLSESVEILLALGNFESETFDCYQEWNGATAGRWMCTIVLCWYAEIPARNISNDRKTTSQLVYFISAFNARVPTIFRCGRRCDLIFLLRGTTHSMDPISSKSWSTLLRPSVRQEWKTFHEYFTEEWFLKRFIEGMYLSTSAPAGLLFLLVIHFGCPFNYTALDTAHNPSMASDVGTFYVAYGPGFFASTEDDDDDTDVSTLRRDVQFYVWNYAST